MSYSRWKVVCTVQGQYDQILREPGEVMELLDVEADGSYPPQIRYLPRKDAQGRPVLDEAGDQVYDEEVVKDRNGDPLHRDYTPDQGEQQIRRGPMKGETMRFGWQRRVPDSVPCGLYPPGTDFWMGELPPDEVPPQVVEKVRAPAGVAPIRGSSARPVRERPPT